MLQQPLFSSTPFSSTLVRSMGRPPQRVMDSVTFMSVLDHIFQAIHCTLKLVHLILQTSSGFPSALPPAPLMDMELCPLFSALYIPGIFSPINDWFFIIIIRFGCCGLWLHIRGRLLTLRLTLCWFFSRGLFFIGSTRLPDRFFYPLGFSPFFPCLPLSDLWLGMSPPGSMLVPLLPHRLHSDLPLFGIGLPRGLLGTVLGTLLIPSPSTIRVLRTVEVMRLFILAPGSALFAPPVVVHLWHSTLLPLITMAVHIHWRGFASSRFNRLVAMSGGI
mmetsp:Transcript_19567/g.30642  ORF Transcript_19567/g.30642 Transcript_19567/m.30642 type:complete len:275 (-) Transcript_19567:635-1459(-)